MDFISNFPFFSIILSLFSAVICSVLRDKAARIVTCIAEFILTVLQAFVLWYTYKLGDYVVYRMGHFSAPWGNEIRFGQLEALMALVFSFILLCSVFGGKFFIRRDISVKKINMYYLLLNLIAAALLAMVYTNDIFTGYVFLEILTLSSCGILMIRRIGRTALAATRYMILNLLGSGLFLLGIILMYDITGHLLMQNMRLAIEELVVSGKYTLPLTVTTGLMCMGLSIKSGLFPFHSWMPDTYGFATPTSAAILSGLISKGYIFLLIKIMYRVIGCGTEPAVTVRTVLYWFGLLGIIIGSVFAMTQKNINRMIAFSSAAQIGYIYMGIGMGTEAGFIAAIFHMLAHAVTKPLLFLSSASLIEVSNGDPVFHSLQGSAHRAKSAGLVFTLGAMSMIGIPLFAGFTSKLLFSLASLGMTTAETFITLVVLAISTILNTMYFARTIIRIYTPSPLSHNPAGIKLSEKVLLTISGFAMLAINIYLGVESSFVSELISTGLNLFS